MNLFAPKSQLSNAEHLQRIKQWVSELLQLKEPVPISISQLCCHEPDCPPVETVIAVMTQPAQIYKIHHPVEELAYQHLKDLLTDASA